MLKSYTLQKDNMKFMQKSLCLVLCLFMVLSVMSIIPVEVFAASANDFIATSYASNLSVKTTKIASLMKYPSSESSYTEHTVSASTMLSVKKLHKDTAGKYWYEILYYGKTLYVDATSATVVDHLTGDVKATNLHSPASLTYGGSFPVRGTITSTLNDLGKVTVAMYKSNNVSRTPAIQSSAEVNGKKYVLDGSVVDDKMYFGNLATGSYTYAVLAEAVSYYINSSGALATSKTEVVLQTKLCVVTTSGNPNPVLHNGIDVSVWNGNIDWATVKNQIDFAILRASWEETADTKFYTNANGCVQNGIPFGVYVYSYAENAAEAKGEAEYVLSLVDGYDLDLPIFLDFEDEIQMNLSASRQQEIVKTFCDTIYAAGKQPGIYTYQWLLRSSTFSDSYYKTIPTWVAEIKSGYTNYPGGLWIWQYSWVGQFSGMSGDVDCNKMYVELPGTGSSDTSYLSKCTYYPSNLTVATTVESSVREYPSSDYTLLETISAGTSLHVTGLYKNAYGNLWYQVERNGKTGYVYSTDVQVKEYLYNDIAIRNPAMASNLALGKGYYIQGELTSKYNNLTTVYAKAYSGENTQETPALTSSYSPNSKEYSLYKSEVDYGLKFGSQPRGYYTYEISVDAKNYYATDATTLASKTENVVVWTSPYTVDNASIEAPNEAVCSHVMVIQPAKDATCTETGLTAGSYCSECGEVFATQTTVPAKGHSYTVTTVPSNCLDYEHSLYTCKNCGDNYSTYLTEENTSDWVETLPDGIPEKLYETKTQYRYSDYTEVKNYQASLDGYSVVKSEWQSQGQKTHDYVTSWGAGGFDKTSSLYTKYNVAPLTAYENATEKRVIDSTKQYGYLYYHWCCPNDNRTSWEYKNGSFTTFHAYYDTTSPDNYTCDTSDMSYKTSNSCCSNADYFCVVPVTRQTYTEYKMQYTHAKWSDWSQWSDTAVTASSTRKVETRTLYRYSTSQLGEHVYEEGFCTHCGRACNHEWVDSVCTICLLKCAHKWHLGGCYVCGKICNHYWADGVCFLCGVKCEHKWTDGVCNICKLHCEHDYHNGYCTICKRACSPHNFVNGVCQICSLVCTHEHWYEGRCSTCGTSCNHNYSQGSCTVCATPCSHNWVDCECTICQLVCTHSFKDGKCSICSFVCEHTWKDGKCTVCSKICNHDFVNGSCTVCHKECVHKWSNGHCTVCGFVCEHIWEDGKCTVCAFVCTHNWEDGKCTICSYECKHNWVAGTCKDCHLVCEHKWEDGKCTVCALKCRHTFEDGVCTNCSYVCIHNWKDGACTICAIRCEHEFENGICIICGTHCDHTWEDSRCTNCGHICSKHSYVDGVCAVCSKERAPLYLYGFINGEDYGYGEDIDNIGIYEFKDGQLVATFTENSYVALKDGDNECFYETNGYPGDNVNLTILYNTDILKDKGDKLFVPKGREITFTLIDNGNDTFTLYYTAAPCKHAEHTTDAVCAICGAQVEHIYKDGVCSVCNLHCNHSFASGICTNCGFECEHEWTQGVCTHCNKVCKHHFKDGACTVCSFVCEHDFFDEYCTNCGLECTHEFVSGQCTICSYVCAHTFEEGICTQCQAVCEHTFRNGICTKCALVCEHTFYNGVCTNCSTVCEHEFEDGECAHCASGEFYLGGYINGECVGCDENFNLMGDFGFVGGELTITLYEDSYVFVKTAQNKNIYMTQGDAKGISATLYNLTSGKQTGLFLLPGGTTLNLTLFTGKNDTLALITEVLNCEHYKHNTLGKCTVCNADTEHTYEAGKCTVCNAQKPEKSMYLFGFINGENHACEENAWHKGDYKFTDGKLTATFTQDSYVAVKTADNSDWYMTNGWQGFNSSSAVLYSTAVGIDADKLFVPGNTEVTFTLVNNGNDTFTLSYVAKKLSAPQVSPKYTKLNCEDDISFDVCFKVTNMSDVSMNDMGIAIFADENADVAETFIEGARAEGNYLVVSTPAVSAEHMIDNVYAKVYAVLSDGSYVYSHMLTLNVVDSAMNVLRNPIASKDEKALMVSLLNFGAQAQLYYGYKTSYLANAELEAVDRVLVKKYSASMVKDSIKADEGKLGSFAKTTVNALVYPTVAFSESFELDFNLIAGGVTAEAKLYYWDEATYAKVGTLSVNNATGVLTMEKNRGGAYTASLDGISAKDLDGTFYASVVYTVNGETQCTGVVAYSVADFFKHNAEKTCDAQSVSQAAIVYAYYAKKLFG